MLVNQGKIEIFALEHKIQQVYVKMFFMGAKSSF
jgi:hypothetical protein